jgi:hypothetical protein
MPVNASLHGIVKFEITNEIRAERNYVDKQKRKK